MARRLVGVEDTRYIVTNVGTIFGQCDLRDNFDEVNEDKHGKCWVGSYSGLRIYNADTWDGKTWCAISDKGGLLRFVREFDADECDSYICPL